MSIHQIPPVRRQSSRTIAFSFHGHDNNHHNIYDCPFIYNLLFLVDTVALDPQRKLFFPKTFFIHQIFRPFFDSFHSFSPRLSNHQYYSPKGNDCQPFLRKTKKAASTRRFIRAWWLIFPFFRTTKPLLFYSVLLTREPIKSASVFPSKNRLTT